MGGGVSFVVMDFGMSDFNTASCYLGLPSPIHPKRSNDTDQVLLEPEYDAIGSRNGDSYLICLKAKILLRGSLNIFCRFLN